MKMIIKCEMCGETIPDDEVIEWEGDEPICHLGIEGCPADGWDFYPCGPLHFEEVPDAQPLRE